MIKAVWFDLDNTLYDQNLYFASSFKTIAQYLTARFAVSEEQVVEKLWTLLRTKGSMHSKLFDDLLDSLELPEPPWVEVLVRLFHRAPVDSLVLYADAPPVLPGLARRYSLGLITNGHPDMQRRKVRALRLGKLLSPQVYTAELGCPKPSARGYEYALEAAKVKPEESVYVGDNPFVDFAGAKKIGMHTARLLRGEFAGVRASRKEIDTEVRDFYELEKWLQEL